MRCWAVLLVILLSGCSYFAKPVEDFTCPRTGFVAGTDKVTFLAPGTTEVGSSAVIKGFTGDCRFKNNQAEINISLPFAVKKGAGGAELKEVQLPYFIAVLTSDDEILQRHAFSTTITFDNTGVGTTTEDHRLKLPLSAPADVHKYKIVMGFALTPDQLDYNKDQK